MECEADCTSTWIVLFCLLMYLPHSMSQMRHDTGSGTTAQRNNRLDERMVLATQARYRSSRCNHSNSHRIHTTQVCMCMECRTSHHRASRASTQQRHSPDLHVHGSQHAVVVVWHAPLAEHEQLGWHLHSPGLHAHGAQHPVVASFGTHLQPLPAQQLLASHLHDSGVQTHDGPHIVDAAVDDAVSATVAALAPPHDPLPQQLIENDGFVRD